MKRLVDFDQAAPRVLCPAGTLVTPYGGLLRHKSDIEHAAQEMGLSMKQAKSHARRVPGHDHACDGLPLAWMLQRPIARDWFDLLSLSEVGGPALLPSTPRFSSAEVSLFRNSPLGFMCNTADLSAGQRNNVRTEYRSAGLGGGLTLDLPVLIATEDLREGDELMSPYHNVAAKSRDFD